MAPLFLQRMSLFTLSHHI